MNNFHNLLNSPRDTSAWIISGTDSLRLGSRMLLKVRGDKSDRNIGGNRANVEKGMRRMWIPDDGYSICQVDQSGAEAMIVAYLCRAAKYRTLFNVGIKPHTYLALKLFRNVWIEKFPKERVDEACNTPIESIGKLPFWKDLSDHIKDSDNWHYSKRYYHFAKKTVHGFSYAMGENTFRQAMLEESEGLINLPFNEAARFKLGFFTEFPEILQWHSRVFEQARVKKQLRNLFGFPYNITYHVNDQDFKDLIAWVPQSTVACITRQAYIRLSEYIAINNKPWHQLGDCHDSYMAEAPDDQVIDLAKKMREFMEIEMTSPFDGTIFRMRSEAQVGKNWGPYNKDYNPNGLTTIKC